MARRHRPLTPEQRADIARYIAMPVADRPSCSTPEPYAAVGHPDHRPSCRTCTHYERELSGRQVICGLGRAEVYPGCSAWMREPGADARIDVEPSIGYEMAQLYLVGPRLP